MRFAAVTLIGGLLAAGPGAAQDYDRLTVVGETDAPNGIYDPSVEYLPDGSRGWLFYSSVGGAGPAVETHLAETTDHGATWTFRQEINSAVPETLLLDGNSVAGVWNTEVTSVAYDPDDPNREWKLFAQRIFRQINPPQNRAELSWIIFLYR